MTNDEAVAVIGKFVRERAVRFHECSYPNELHRINDPANLHIVGVVINGGFGIHADEFFDALRTLAGIES